MNHDHSYRTGDGAQHPHRLVKQWLSKASGDLLLAEQLLGGGIDPNFDAACFHAQQAIEKLMKAVLVARGIEPPRVHDLVRLSDDLRELIPSWSWDVEELSVLGAAAVEMRYPSYESTRTDAARMVAIAARLWAALRPLV